MPITLKSYLAKKCVCGGAIQKMPITLKLYLAKKCVYGGGYSPPVSPVAPCLYLFA